ncbi:S8 family serine peptidase [Kaarinaea lacus]
MKHQFSTLVIGLICFLSTQFVSAEAPLDVKSDAQSSFIFLFSATVAADDMPGLAASLTTTYNGELRHVYTNVLQGFSATMSSGDALNLVNDNPGLVDSYVNNGLASVNGGGGKGGAKGGKNADGGRIKGPEIESWGVSVVGGSQDATAGSVTRHAWIIDTGIDDYYDGHELTIGVGDNFVTKGKDITDDTNGHGTHIAGILAAFANNDKGVKGIASGATVHPVRVLHKNLWGTTDDILAGIEYTANKIASDYNGPKHRHVVNMSLTVEIAGQEATAALIDTAVNNLAGTGVKFAVCAGNDGVYAGLYTPAHLSLTNGNVYTVAAIDSAGNLAADSNYGGDVIDFVAPGIGIESLKPGGGTWFWSGCSMATPHVAGILLFQDPDPVWPHISGYPLAHF